MTTHFSIDLGLPGIEVTQVDTDEHGHYHIGIRSTATEGQCRLCGRAITTFHEYGREICIRHLPILGRECYLYIRLPRFQCDHCPKQPTTTQQPSWRERNSRYTKAYEEHLLKSLIGSTISEISRQEGITEGCLSRLLERQVQTTVDWGTVGQVGQLGIDEISLRKGHKDFVTILNAAKEVLGQQIRIVIDRFHVAKLYRKGLDTLRKQEMKRLKKHWIRLPMLNYVG